MERCVLPVACASWTWVKPRALRMAVSRGPKLESSFFLRGISRAIVKAESRERLGVALIIYTQCILLWTVYGNQQSYKKSASPLDRFWAEGAKRRPQGEMTEWRASPTRKSSGSSGR